MEYRLLLLKSLLMILFCERIGCLPSNRTPKSETDLNKKGGQKHYLAQYGYMGGNNQETGSDNKPTEIIISDKEFNKAVITFQKTWHLNETGVVDEPTRSLMQSKRCGNSDKGLIQIKRTKRFRINGRWYKRALTYRIRNYTPDLPSTQVQQAIVRGFNEWAKVAALTFRRVYTTPDIDIRFASYSHGDGIPFDGRRGSLAHAFSPSVGDIHFDESEVWTLNTGSGTDLFQIAVHEIGHSLGLGHSNQYGAVMFPYYSYQPNWAFSSDDIRGIRAIYGRQTQSTTTSNPNAPTTTTIQSSTTSGSTTSSSSTTSGPTPAPGLFCSNSNIDAITLDLLGRIFVFKGEHFALLTSNGIAPGYPKLIASDLPDLPSNIDAGVYIPASYRVRCNYNRRTRRRRCRRVTIDAGGTFLFKIVYGGGNQSRCGGQDTTLYSTDLNDTYYLYRNGFKNSGLISKRFPGMPIDIDSAYTLEKDKLYFIKGDQLWRMTVSTKSVDAGYPKSLSATIAGLPSKIDAVIQAPHRFYVIRYYFSGNQYYRITGLYSTTVDVSSIPYPRPIGKWWFGCPAATSSEVSSIRQMELEIKDIMKPDDTFMDQNGNILNLNETQITWDDDGISVAPIVRLSIWMEIYLIISVFIITQL